MVHSVKSKRWAGCFALLALALVTATVVLALNPLAARAATSALYVSPGGNDANPGTQSQPIQTLQHAQSLVRALNQNMTGDVTVYLENGIYRLSQPLSLGTADSGTNGFSLIFMAIMVMASL